MRTKLSLRSNRIECAMPILVAIIKSTDVQYKGEPVPLRVVVHPALAKYNIKLEMNESSDHGYGLPNEDMNVPAVHPPVLAL